MAKAPQSYDVTKKRENISKLQSAKSSLVKQIKQLQKDITAVVKARGIFGTRIDPKKLFKEPPLKKYAYYKDVDNKIIANEKWSDPDYLYNRSKKNKVIKKALQKLLKSFSGEAYTDSDVKKLSTDSKYGQDSRIRLLSRDIMNQAEVNNFNPEILLKIYLSFEIGFREKNIGSAEESYSIKVIKDLVLNSKINLANIKVQGFKHYLRWLKTQRQNVLSYCAYGTKKFWIPPINRKRKDWNGFLVSSITILVPTDVSFIKDTATGKIEKYVKFTEVIHRLYPAGDELNTNRIDESSAKKPAGKCWLIFDDSGKEVCFAFDKAPRTSLIGPEYEIQDGKRIQKRWAIKF